MPSKPILRKPKQDVPHPSGKEMHQDDDGDDGGDDDDDGAIWHIQCQGEVI